MKGSSRETQGILITHVDDLLTAGTEEKYKQALASLEKRIELKFTKPPLVYCGKEIQQTEDGIRVHQAEATLILEESGLSKQRRA
eukprot:1228382-Amphidinium_carterae.1